MLKFFYILNLIAISNLIVINSSFSADTIFEKKNIKLNTEIEIFDINKKKLKVGEIFINNKKYFVNFWATWCQPCKKELPDLIKIKNKFLDSDLEILIISIDKKNINEQVNFLKKLKVDSLTSFYDINMELFNNLSLRGIPTSLIISNNLVISKKEGLITFNKKVIRYLKSIIKSK